MKRLLSLSFLIAGSALCAQSFEWDTPQRVVPAHPKEVQLGSAPSTPEQQTGLADVYASEAQGSTTAYGETYDASAMTGSHPTYPLGTLLRVTNVQNGRSAVVRVTDKCDDCLITLSEVAARELGIEVRSQVSLERSGFSNWNPLPPTQTAAASTPSGYRSVDGVLVNPRPRQASPVPAVTTRSVLTRSDSTPKEVEPAPAPATFARRVAIMDAQPSVVPPTPTVPGRQIAARGSEVVRPAAVSDSESTNDRGDYAVQLAAYNNETYALRRVTELKEQGLTDVYYRVVTKPDGQVINRVYAGTFVNVTDAQAAARAIQGKYNIAGIVAKM